MKNNFFITRNWIKILTKSSVLVLLILFYGFTIKSNTVLPIVKNNLTKPVAKNNPFKLVFQQYAFKSENKDWEDWKKGQNIFIINYNDNGDVLHYLSGGTKKLYTMRKGWEKTTKYNEDYSIAEFITDDGEEISIQVYYAPRTFIKIISVGSYIIQFDDILK